jgi:DNA replication and repair protein RecF
VRVEALELVDFRNYEHASIQLSGGPTLVMGRNAQGKTSLLEAVFCLSGLSSPRGPDQALVRQGAERALLHGLIRRGERSVELDLEIREGRRRALINKTPVRSAPSLTEVMAAVFFGPDELSLIKGSPEGRRRFLDDLVVELRPVRSSLRREWERVLRQKNALLRSAPRGGSEKTLKTLDVWDESLVKAGAALTRARLECLALLQPAARRRWAEIASEGRLDVSYKSSWLPQKVGDHAVSSGGTEEEELQRHLELAIAQARPRELERGSALTGPQRDDVYVGVSSSQGRAVMDARTFGSQGEQRTAALALKAGEFDMVTEATREQPILLLDDVFSELDPLRRGWLGEAVGGMDQTILTSAEPGAAEALGATTILEVVDGSVKQL